MYQEILLAILGFILGMMATILTQSLSRHWRYEEGRRKRKIAQLKKVSDWMESYLVLFECKYPEFSELILAHKMLSPQDIHYDNTAPIRVYSALKEYQATKANHDEIARKGFIALQSLSDKKWDNLYGINVSLSHILRKLHLLRDIYLFPVSFTSTVTGHLELIGEYRYKVFVEFPDKAIERLEWEKLDSTAPEEVYTIIHPWLKYYEGNEEKSAYHEREIRMYDAMNNLSFYRHRARQEIDCVLAEVYRREEEWFVPDGN